MTKILDSIQNRRSRYGLSKERIVDIEEIKKMTDEANRLVPTAFHSQANRTVVLFGEESDGFWEILMKSMREMMPEEKFLPTEEKINSFKAGYGTILYYIDQSIVKRLQEQYPLYSANFPVWAEQSSGMLQLVIWSSLQELGLGSSLQHYTEIIEEQVKKQWDIPKDWKLIAQMPFGKPTDILKEKDFFSTEERVRFIGK